MEKDKKYLGGNGLARVCYDDNSIYEGVLRKGKKHGYGRLISSDGTIKEGIYENDDFKRKETIIHHWKRNFIYYPNIFQFM